MALIDLSKKEIHCKIVYYGPGRCGKTTNLLYIYNTMNENSRGKMLTIETKGDRTLFFDLLPLNLGKVSGFDIRIQLYTVPGQTMYAATRKLVLKGVDGLVFVADSLKVRKAKNIESLEDLRQNLQDYKIDIHEIPLVIQFNKRDLAATPIPILSVEEMEQDLNSELKTATFEASAVKGAGVFETLKEISKRTVRYVATKHLIGPRGAKKA
ncbi:GTPase domain-containing protein [Dissulfurirhabdus thermomarina]|uniref:GTPase domain-containing protein n=1 Tax=Dissulfurirhabdus thermomarina TaxID=1765737 RepID=A0A6N9TTG2_DISTH|nr:GTPase domain-containing protein [Dissulfurirhabdus thermomarina]NDY41786.1 GTPase domain-containing protein [Dissulfurirhabdus thermomarina]NMX23972.1 GTPase domain-containing protein [Dissulfurirhabdus thermomarina]